MHCDGADAAGPESGIPENVVLTDEVRAYVLKRKQDFRVCTSCGGPILLPVSVKLPKPSDLRVKVGDHTVYISLYQARYHDVIHAGMIPRSRDYY
ncbi:MAG: hypothetical protein LUO86_01970 [Methanomicrobiales archaeon]|jgi:hypothetical protein|nr:hypothetical protein [Methanomicrobiales archaeon]MDD1654600.1 hypothetical protein [Methanomicrobiales archaeon]